MIASYQTFSYKRSILVIILLLVIAITFETFQQVYYIKTFNTSQEPDILYLLKTQSYKWLIWVVLATPLVMYIKRVTKKEKLVFLNLVSLAGMIVGLVILNILLVSLLQVFHSEKPFSMAALVEGWIPFYTFQKSPIYTLGYITVSIILFFYFINSELLVEVQKLSELKDNNLSLYNELKSKIEDRTTILNVKIGNKRKIIPVEQILWIEADDYCVKVHLVDGASYTMRSSLKTLEQKLQKPFLRVHRKAIVNMSMANELVSSKLPTLILNDNTEIPVSKSHLKTIKAFIS